MTPPKKKPAQPHQCNGPNCRHAERAEGNWMRVRDPASLDRVTADMVPVPENAQIEALAQRLLSFGLMPWETEVLIQRDVMKLSFGDIAVGAGYTSTNAVLRIYKLGREKAKKAYLRGMKNA